MKRYSIILIISIFMGALSSCVYSFQPAGVVEMEGLIVIEGEILYGYPSSFSISTSTLINDSKSEIIPIEPINIYVESEGTGVTYPGVKSVVTDKKYKWNSKYVYTCSTETINPDIRSRLVVVLEGGKKYVSDWTEFTFSSMIDSITYKVADDQKSLTIYVNSHETDDRYRYYKWSYKEDWEFHPSYRATYYYDVDSNLVKPLENWANENRYYCWRHEESSELLLFSTASLADNVVSEMPIKTIDYHDNRLQYLYAIEVRQMILSEECYSYWSTMLKNSEQTGGLFSPQPNELRGNITCEDNPDEVVLGYIYAGTLQATRLFIEREEAPIYRTETICAEMQSLVNPEDWVLAYRTGLDVIYIDNTTGEIFWGDAPCVDCRKLGMKAKPDFWPNNHF